MERLSAGSARQVARLDRARFAALWNADLKPRLPFRGGRIAAPCHPADARAFPEFAGRWLGCRPPALLSRYPPADNWASRCQTARARDQTAPAPPAPAVGTPPLSNWWARG